MQPYASSATHLVRGGLLASTILAGLCGAAEATVLAPGETLRARFHFDTVPVLATPGFPADFYVLDGLFGTINLTRVSGVGAPSAHIGMSNGSTLIGSLDFTFATPFTTFGFAAPGSLLDFDRIGLNADLSPFADGTVDGILDITNTSAATFDYTGVSIYVVGHAVGAQQLINFSSAPVFDFLGRPADDPRTIPADVPEPATLGLLGLGIATLGGFRRKPV